MTGIFYSWDCSIFQYQTMCKSSVELGLVYKTFVNKHTWETLLLPGKTNCFHCLRNAGFFGKLNKVIVPSQPKTHFFRDILPERVRPVQLNEMRWWAHIVLALIDTCMGAFFREKYPYKEFHRRLRHEEPRSKKNSLKLVRSRKEDFWHRNSVIRPNCFLKLWPSLWKSNSLTV